MPKLHNHLQLLAPSEHKAFRRFLNSPYHNRNPKLPELFEILGHHLFQSPPREISEEEAAARLFPGEAYDQNRYRKLGTALLNCLHEFFRLEAFRQDAPRRELYLMQRFLENDADAILPRQIENTRAAIDNAHLSPVDRNALKVNFGLEAYAFETVRSSRRPSIRPDQILQSLEDHYRIRKSMLLYLQLNHHRITGDGLPPDGAAFIKGMLGLGEELPIEARLYLLLYECSASPENPETFPRLRQLLSEHGEDLSPSDAEDIYVGLLNYCTMRINQGESAFLREMWLLYVEMLDVGIFRDRGTLLQSHFKNMMSVAARLGEFEWAESFLDGPELRLRGDHAHNAFHFGHGVLAFSRGNGEQAARHFHRILNDYSDLFYGLDARVYLLRIYFEAGDVTGLDALCDSFRMFLKRNKQLPRERKANYNHFVNCIRRLSRIPQHEKERLQKLRQDIAEGRRIGATGWLLRKVDQLLQDK